MAKLYGRKIELQIKGISVTDLRIKFRITRSTESKLATKNDMAIYNLSAEHRKVLVDTENLLVVLNAGYQENYALLFQGKTRQIIHGIENADWVTQIRCGDGDVELSTTRLNKSYKAGERFTNVLLDVAKSFNLGIPADALQKLQNGKLSEGLIQFINGFSVYGDAKKKFDDLVRAANLEWDVQHEKIRVIDKGSVLPGNTIVLNNASGLIGSPEIGTKSRTSATSLLQPAFVPFQQVTLQSAGITGDYRIEKVVHIGDTHGNEWYSQLELSRL